jgi:DNA polymerase
MSGRPAPTLAESIAAAQDWWREAGVDFTYHDEPAGWLAVEAPVAEPVAREAATPAPAPRTPERPPVGGDRSRWPQDLAGFARWWLDEPSLDDGGLHPRVAPRCVDSAELLMLVPMPEAEDHESLLSGPHGRLLTSFALAAGFAPDTVAVAAALPRHTAAPDWDGLAARGHGEVLLHLLALAAPKRLIVLGRRILPLLQHDLPQGAPSVSELTIQGRSMPLLSTYAPENLLMHARERAGLWQRWLEWTDPDAR